MTKIRKPRGNIQELIERTKKEAEEKILRYEEKLKAIEIKEEKPKKKKALYVLGCSGIEELQEHIEEYEKYFMDEINELSKYFSNLSKKMEDLEKRMAGKPSFEEQKDAIIIQLQLDTAALRKDIISIYRLVPELGNKYRELPKEDCTPEESLNPTK